jgi:hypothetical protein
MHAKERIQHVPYTEILPSVPYNLNVSQMKRLRNILSNQFCKYLYIYINTQCIEYFYNLELLDTV